jgi:hypothetical protein
MTDDGFIQVPADSVGKKVDTAEILRADTQVTVERQRVEVRDDEDEVLNTSAIVAKLDETNQLLFQILNLLNSNATFSTMEL